MKKISIFLFFISTVLVLSACGGEDQAIQSQAESYVMQYLPKQNSIVIPKPLLGKQANSSERSFRAIESSSETDSAFAKINYRITEAEVSRLSNQIPLLMLDAVWPEIQSYCKNSAPGTACTIPQGTITLQLTDEIIAAAEAVVEKIDSINNNQQGDVEFEVSEPAETTQLSIMSGEYIRLGTIVYTAFSAEELFQHEVSLDVFEMGKIKGLDNDDATTLLLKWSGDERSVVSSYHFKNSESNYVYTYNYINDGNEESVKIQYSGSDNYPANLPNTYIEVVTLKVLDDSNNATLVEFEWRNSNESGMQFLSAVGEVNNDYGSLKTDFSSDYNSRGEEESISYRKEETFDNKGNTINSAVCEADCENKGAWTAAGSTISSGNTTTINGDKNETTITETVTESESPLIDIFVSGLEDGFYIIAVDGFDGSIEDRLGHGSVTEGIAEFSYWGGEAEIENVRVYTFQVINDEAGYRPGYIEIDTAQITILE